MKVTFLSRNGYRSITTTVPAEIVKKLGLKSGDRFLWLLDEDKIIIKPLRDGEN